MTDKAKKLLRDNADARALEATPLSQLMAAENAFDYVRLAAQAYPDNIALKLLVPGDVEAAPDEISYRDFLGNCYRTANALHELGLRPGEVVCVLLPLVAPAFYLVVGGEAAGIVSMINPMLQDWQIAEIVKAAGAKIIVAPGPNIAPDIWAKIEMLQGELDELEAVVHVGGGPEGDGLYAFETLVAAQPSDRLISGREIKGEDIAAYYHTGGTTGTPKLAQHTHYMQAMQLWSTGATLGVGPDDVISFGLPLFHIGGSIVTAMTMLAHGGTLVVLSPAGFRDPAAVRDLWLNVHKHRMTIVGAVPTVLGALLNIPIGNADISSIRYFATGGSALPTEVGRALAEMTGKPVFEGYGMTETTSYVTFPPVGGEMCLGSVGVVMPHCQVKVVKLDQAGEIADDCDLDEIGVVVIKGPSITPGYIQSQYNAGTLLADGWLNSGDLGRMDAEGRLWLTGRAKDLIIRGGHNIDPVVIEETLHRHPAVEMAAAVGKPDSYAGELPVAYIQLRPGATAGSDELQAFAREHIPERAAAPVNVFLTADMPLTAVGKIFKPQLRWDAAERVFGELLAPLAADVGRSIEVAVGSHEIHGAMATVSVSGTNEPEVAEKIAELLRPFTLRHEIAWGQA